MSRNSTWLLAGALAALAACQVDDRATKQRLDKMIDQADQLEHRIDQIAAHGGIASATPPRPNPRPTPARPDPTAVYSVPIGSSPALGPATAKVTIVEAGDFA